MCVSFPVFPGSIVALRQPVDEIQVSEGAVASGDAPPLRVPNRTAGEPLVRRR